MPNIRQVMTAAAGVSTAVKFAIWGAGRNDAGNLGDGTTIDSRIPIPVLEFNHDVKKLLAGSYHSAILTVQGKLYSWGFNGVKNIIIF